jgi:hypothetical protein
VLGAGRRQFVREDGKELKCDGRGGWLTFSPRSRPGRSRSRVQWRS